MCTGTGAARCVEERLAWELYDEHGYRPHELRPCLSVPQGVAAEHPSRSLHRALRPLRDGLKWLPRVGRR